MGSMTPRELARAQLLAIYDSSLPVITDGLARAERTNVRGTLVRSIWPSSARSFASRWVSGLEWPDELRAQ